MAGPSLATARLLLRPWRDSDRAPFAAMNADPQVTEHLLGPLTAPQSDALAQRIEAHFETHGFGFWAVEVPGTAPFIGFVGLGVPAFDAFFTPAVEIGWRLAAPYWGKGYATEAARAAVGFGFGPLGLAELVAFTVPANHRSRAVMCRLGMRHRPDETFDHPRLAEGHPLRPHLLYRLARIP